MSEYILMFIEFLKQFSYFGVLFALCFEFVPAEVVLPLAGYWIYQGEFNIHLMALAGTIGGTIGPMTLYALGKYGGRPLVEKYGKYFLINHKQIEASDRFFKKYGAGVAFFARFLPGVRTAISIPCGMTKMNFAKFSIYTFLAMYPITYFYLYLGLKFGPHWEEAGKVFNQYMYPLVIVLVLVLSIYFVVKRNKNK
ncbi:DedA family protein [[Brevibacterium] frigoritolerans]|nr:DedA family protein [Peribacillus frigoritolerans]